MNKNEKRSGIDGYGWERTDGSGPAESDDAWDPASGDQPRHKRSSALRWWAGIMAVLLVLIWYNCTRPSQYARRKLPEIPAATTVAPTTPTKETAAVATKAPTEAPTDAVTEAATEALDQTAAPTEWRGWEKDYPVNLNSGVFHNPGAGCIKNSTNIKIVHGTTEDLKDMGYRPCGRCF